MGKKSEADYREAVNAAPDDMGPRLKLAHYLYLKDRNEEAEAICRLVIERDPGNGLAWFRLAQIFADQEQIEESMKACQKACELKPEPQADRPWKLLGDLLMYQDRFPEAEQAYRQALDSFVIELYWNDLGHSLFNQERYEEGKKPTVLRLRCMTKALNLGSIWGMRSCIKTGRRKRRWPGGRHLTSSRTLSMVISGWVSSSLIGAHSSRRNEPFAPYLNRNPKTWRR